MPIESTPPPRLNIANPLTFAQRRAVRSLFTASLALMLAACGGDSRNHAASDPVEAPIDYSALQSSVSAQVDSGMKALGVKGLSVAFVDGGRVPRARGFGVADAEAGIAADVDTVYEAGSVSKLFTATAILQLAERGKIQLDRPVEDVLTDFCIRSRFASSEAITPRRLLTHHAGIPEDMSQGSFSSTPVPLARQVAKLADEYLAYPPGQIGTYSNVGFNVLGRAVGAAFRARLLPSTGQRCRCSRGRRPQGRGLASAQHTTGATATRPRGRRFALARRLV